MNAANLDDASRVLRAAFGENAMLDELRRLHGIHTRFSLDPDGPTELTCSDGLVIPWRPTRSFRGDPLERGVDIDPLGLLGSPYLRQIDTLARTCLECDGTGMFLLPDDDKVVCVACRGTGERPFAYVGQDFAVEPLPEDLDPEPYYIAEDESRHSVDAILASARSDQDILYQLSAWKPRAGYAQELSAYEGAI